ncbi:MAG: FAD-dependent oxidoreductase, partial [bacterium]|nr:FAD-dependent oxidoreductase [bacterium]
PAVLNPAVLCRELEVEEIRQLVRACGEGAYRAVMAGFDMIDVHAHTGYLVDQFMTPLWNRRRDEYGAGFEGRMRFPLEIVRAIRERVGERIPISFRLTAEHGIEGGRTLEEARAIARRLEQAGVDMLTIDAGCYDAEHRMTPPVYLGEACQVDLAAAIREVVDVPVTAVGNITRPELAEEILARGQADFIGLGRSLLADPQWVDKARQGRRDQIRPCIMCNEYCLGRMPAACMVNPQLGRERELAVTPAARRKTVMVVGGGPGGMETARVAALRGHDVTLHERGPELGGQLNPGGAPDYKRSLHAVRDCLAVEIRRAGVRVHLGSVVDAGMVRACAPDAVVIATGATPGSFPIPGTDAGHCLSVLELHAGPREVGAEVIVAGGGLNGCDAAVDLAKQGKKVTLLELDSEIARDLNPISRGALLRVLDEVGVRVVTGHELREIIPEGVIAVDPQGGRQRFRGDTVILALGVESRKDLARELADEAPEVHVIGDCVAPRKIGEAIHEGFGAGMKL